MNVIFYGTTLCPDCRAAIELFEKNNVKPDFRSFTDDLKIMKEFLTLRDTSEKFVQVKANGGIGIPAFVFEDGTVTLDENEALAELKR